MRTSSGQYVPHPGRSKRPMRPRTVLASALAALTLAATARAQAPPLKELERVQDAIDVLAESSKIPAKGIPAALLKNSQGVVIVPGLVKAGFIIGGERGKGVVSVRDEHGNW